MKWWDWPAERISAAIPLIHSGNLEALKPML